MNRHISLIHNPSTLTDRACETLARTFDIRELRLTKAGRVAVMEGQVPCYRMKKLAGAAAARLLGVLGVVNQLRVVPQSHRPDGELAETVRVALRSCPHLVSEEIAITARDGIVTLRGNVSSSTLRCEAEEAAWAVGGAMDVKNQLQVQPLPTGNGWADLEDASLSAARRYPLGKDVCDELEE